MRIPAMILVVVMMIVSFVPSFARGQTVDPADAVFQIFTSSRDVNDKGLVRFLEYGTAFFINSDGTALTASHIVYTSAHNSSTRLIAVVGKEFFNADVVCASKLPYDPTNGDHDSGVPFSRDIAEIKLSPSDAYNGKKDTLYRVIKEQRYELAKAHRDPLPAFPFLKVGTRLSIGMHVRVIGFGDISAIPYKWTSEGTIDNTYRARSDGTPIIDIIARSPPQPGNSGSPVLTDQSETIGLWTWYSLHGDRTKSQAQGYEVLQHPCQ